MRARYVYLLVASCILSGPATARAQTPDDINPGEKFHVEFGTVFWQPSPKLVINTDSGISIGVTEFDFAEQFGIETKRFSEFRFVAKAARKHKVRVSYVPVKYEETADIPPITFNGTTFSGRAAVNITWDLWRFGYEWDFISDEKGFFGMLADVKYNAVDAAVQSGLLAEASGADAPIPGIGIIARRYVHPKVAISGEFTGFKLVAGDVDGSLFDFDISATVNIFKNFGATGGYRSVNANYDITDVDVLDTGELTLRGLYFGIVTRF
jgi:hypothetical protein